MTIASDWNCATKSSASRKKARIGAFTLIFCIFLLPISGQSLYELQQQREHLQEKLRASQSDLEQTQSDISSGQLNSQVLGDELLAKLASIQDAEVRMTELSKMIMQLQTEMRQIDAQLQSKKEKFARALRMSRAYRRHSTSPILFILSGKSLTGMSRRSRNANFYASIMRAIGEDLNRKQCQLLTLQNNLLTAKNEMNILMRDVMKQRHALGLKQTAQMKQIASLDSKENELQYQLGQQRSQMAELNSKIDQVVEAENKREEAARKKRNASKSTNTVTGKALTEQDKDINSSLEQNRGRLPVPITGSYTIGDRAGTYSIPEASNVKFDNKGINYIGHPGAKARTVFDGVVTAIFQFYGSKGVLIRHGSYISVYCNLSTVIVRQGQKVHTRDFIGAIATSPDNQCILHFQLRKETTKLNPEQWLSR